MSDLGSVILSNEDNSYAGEPTTASHVVRVVFVDDALVRMYLRDHQVPSTADTSFVTFDARITTMGGVPSPWGVVSALWSQLSTPPEFAIHGAVIWIDTKRWWMRWDPPIEPDQQVPMDEIHEPNIIESVPRPGL